MSSCLNAASFQCVTNHLSYKLKTLTGLCARGCACTYNYTHRSTHTHVRGESCETPVNQEDTLICMHPFNKSVRPKEALRLPRFVAGHSDPMCDCVRTASRCWPCCSWSVGGSTFRSLFLLQMFS